MDLVVIRQAVADVVAQATGSCYWYEPWAPQAPCAYVALAREPFVDYLQTFARGFAQVKLRIVLLAPAAIEVDANTRLSRWMSTGSSESIPDAWWADRTLGGMASDSILRFAENAGYVEIPPDTQKVFLMAEMAIDIQLPGT